jgi:hypothetical protein
MVSNYRQIPGKLANLAPFTGNSMSAYFAGGTYHVLSYETVIATVTPREDGPGFQTRIVSSNLWGPTTGRHRNLCIAHLPGEPKHMVPLDMVVPLAVAS